MMGYDVVSVWIQDKLSCDSPSKYEKQSDSYTQEEGV